MSLLAIGLLVLQSYCAAMTGIRVDDHSQFVSVAELLAACGVPGRCGVTMACEGTIAKVKGSVDYDNIFDKARYPQLPYEKFTLRDPQGPAIEVWAVSQENREIFEEINRYRSSPEKMAYIEAEVIGFDMPVMGQCLRGLKLTLRGVDKIFFR
jgi:hypothetical protein